MDREYSWIALALAAVAGAVDGIGYLLLYRIFTSHMSGNTVAMTLDAAHGNWAQTWGHLEPIVVFFAGIVAGIVLADVLSALRVKRLFSIVAGFETALLVIFFLLAHPAQHWMLVWPASAMGIQNALLRRVGHHKVRTTFITGMLTNTAQGLVETAHALLARSGEARKKFADFTFYGGIWLCFASGGVLAAFLALAHGAAALLLPVGGLLVLIAYDIANPLVASGAVQASGESGG